MLPSIFGENLFDDFFGSPFDEEFFRLILDTASGRPAQNEKHAFEEIAIFKDGVTL